MKFRNLTLSALLFFAVKMAAQDIHFTQFYMMPQTLNPALAGKFEGSVRFGGIYRDQWRSVIGSGVYATPGAFVDAPIIKGFRKKDWIGVGISLFQDQAGTLALVHKGLRIGPTYHIALDSKRTNVLSLGYTFGGESYTLDRDKAKLYDQFISNAPQSLDYASLAQSDKKYKDHGAGIALTSKLNKTTDFQLGFALYHLTRPRATAQNTGKRDLSRRAVLHGQFNVALNKQTTLTPQFIFQKMGGAKEIAVQGIAGYLLNKNKQIYLDGGLGYRLSDAVELLAGMRYKALKVGLAYDVNTSSLRSESNRKGGFEIAANYIVRIYKQPVRKQQVLCPRF